MNSFLNVLKDNTDFTYTENGAVTRTTTKSDLLDMFALGAAMRNRSDSDCILMFRKAFEENPVYALKCLFYLRDVRGGQGERRFFKVCMKDLALTNTEAARRNLKLIPLYGRWDDLYLFIGTPLENEALDFMKWQLALDIHSKAPSLLAKWIKSENTSSFESRKLARITREYFGMSHKQYRKVLSMLRERINIVERLMSENRWDEIEFDKIPSRAGMIYKNAFARHDIERMKNEAVQSYADFAKDATKTVNAKTLYPYECVDAAFKVIDKHRTWSRHQKGLDLALDNTERLMVNKYWENLENYFKDASFEGLAVVDVSGSMFGCSASAPINVAVSLGLYCADKAKGPFANHFITFSERPQLVKSEGVDFCDKVYRMSEADWGMNTNIEAVFDLLLNTALNSNCSQNDIPKNIIIISDMEFDACVRDRSPWGSRSIHDKETLFEGIKRKWRAHGLDMPKLTFWNVDARSNNIPMRDDGYVNYVSGMSPTIFEQIMKGLSAYDLMMDKLNDARYELIK